MPMSTACDKCGRVTATFPYADGAAHFCAACMPQDEPCAPFLHDWHGSRVPGGMWLCWRCKTALASQEITTTRMEAAAGAIDDAY